MIAKTNFHGIDRVFMQELHSDYAQRDTRNLRASLCSQDMFI